MTATDEPSSRLHIATASSREYLPWCATALLSCLRATSDIAVRVHVIRDQQAWGESEERRLRTMVEDLGTEVDFHDVDYDRLAGLPASVAAHGGPISCARLILPETIPDVDRCLYIDADTLTVSSLASLATLPIDDAPIGAVLNVVEPSMRESLHALGFSEPLRYLNSGVLLMNLDYMRRHGAADELLGYMRDREDSLIWGDQGALNAVFAGAWLELHPRWNTQNSYWHWHGWATETFGPKLLAEAISDPAILHFEGPLLAKPWHYLSNHSYRREYRATLAATPWGPLPLEDRTVATRLIARLPWNQRVAAYLRILEFRRRRENVLWDSSG